MLSTFFIYDYRDVSLKKNGFIFLDFELVCPEKLI